MVDRAAVPVLSDLDGKAHGAYGLEGMSAPVLVPPDGHIAFRSGQLTAYCRKTFGAAVVTGMSTSNGSVEEAIV